MPDASLLPQGRKSEVTLTNSGTLVRKIYNDNGDPVAKYLREVGFYEHYGTSGLIPDLVERVPDEPAIVITRAQGVRCSDRRSDRDQRSRLSRDYAERVVDLVSMGRDASTLKRRHNPYWCAQTVFSVLAAARRVRGINGGCPSLCGICPGRRHRGRFRAQRKAVGREPSGVGVPAARRRPLGGVGGAPLVQHPGVLRASSDGIVGDGLVPSRSRETAHPDAGDRAPFGHVRAALRFSIRRARSTAYVVTRRSRGSSTVP